MRLSLEEFIKIIPESECIFHDLTRKLIFIQEDYLIKISNLHQPSKLLGEKSILSLKHPYLIDIKYYTESDLTNKKDEPCLIEGEEVIIKTRFKYIPSTIKYGIITELGSVDLETWMYRVKNQNIESYQIIKRKFLTQAIEAVNFLAKHNLVHDDIKPDNLVIFNLENISDLLHDKGNCCIKLIDFEFCFSLDKIKTVGKIITGCVYFSSPEKLSQLEYGSTTDLWSVGATFYEVFTGCLLNGSKEDIPRLEYVTWMKDLYVNYKEGFEEDWINFDLIPDRIAQKMIKQLLSMDPTKRNK